MKYTLPTDSTARKDIPLYSGCMMYFPAALAGVAKHSKLGNDKHNPGQPLHHSRGKSNDHADCIARHLMDIGDLLAVIERSTADAQYTAAEVEALLTEANANAWRALALSQELHERFGGAPLAPRARIEAPTPPPVEPMSLDSTSTTLPLPPRACRPCAVDGCSNEAELLSSNCKVHRPPRV